MQGLIGDLLERVRLGEHELVTEPLRLESLVDEVVRDLEPSLLEADAEVRVARPLGVVEGDAVLMRQVLYNLLSNAIKYRVEERALRVDIFAERDRDDVLELCVRDNGRGFGAALADTLFEPFTRVGGTEVEGSGLGLANCRSVCQRLGWTIGASGRPNAGAEFRVRFAAS